MWLYDTLYYNTLYNNEFWKVFTTPALKKIFEDSETYN